MKKLIKKTIEVLHKKTIQKNILLVVGILAAVAIAATLIHIESVEEHYNGVQADILSDNPKTLEKITEPSANADNATIDNTATKDNTSDGKNSGSTGNDNINASTDADTGDNVNTEASTKTSTIPDNSAPPTITNSTNITPSSTTDSNKHNTANTTPASNPTTPSPQTQQIYISINCSTILDNMDMLDESLKNEKYIPSDGVILDACAYAYKDGVTVFDLLSQAIKDAKIHMEYQGIDVSSYDSVYIQGINHIYEFSCGPLSGWMYKVNGQFFQFGCSNYKLKPGDVVEWIYTCDLGYDIGGGYANGKESE